MTTKYLTVNYRRASTSHAKNLETFLRDCLDKEVENGKRFSQAPASRTMIQGTDSKEILLNEFADVNDGVAGILCEISPNSLQPILTKESEKTQLSNLTNAEIFKISEQRAGKNNDFVQGLCYFYVRKNHLLFATVKGFRKSDISAFLFWLANKFGTEKLELSAKLDKAENGTKLGRISKFKIKGSSSGGDGVTLGVEREVKKRAGARTVAWSKAEDVVKTILPDQTFHTLINSMSKGNHLVADVEWSVSGPRGRKVTEALASVVTELADMEDGIVGIAGKDGIMSNGGVILETKRAFDIAEDRTFVIDFNHATDVMVEQIERWVKDKQIIV